MDDRLRRVLDYTDGRTVLDLGCVQHDPSKIGADDWLHGHLAARFETVIGVDVHEAGVQEMREEGYAAHCADATAFDLPVTADTVVAGELIEHVTNPGGLVECAYDHLRPGGRFILTTPNPWGLPYLRRLVGGRASVNGEHTAWYGPRVLEQLLKRYDFDIEIMETTRRNHGGLARVAQALDSDVFSGTTWVAVARKPEESA